MTDYDQLRPYVVSSGLRWSYGAMRGTSAADWQLALPPVGDSALVDDLASAGFCAVEVDTQGLSQPTSTVATLTSALGSPIATTSDGVLVAFDLRGRRAALIASLGSSAVEQRGDRVLNRCPGVVTVDVAPASDTARPPSRLVSTWAPLGVVALVPLFLLFGRSHQIGDPDTFWHIRAGDYLLQTWQFAGPDPWSPFTTNTWVLHEWVPELALSLANRVDGLTGVAWAWYMGTVFVAFAFYASCRSQGRIVLSAIATVLALLGAAASLTPRPQLVSIALAAVVTAAWLSSARDGRPDGGWSHDLGVGVLARNVVRQPPHRRRRGPRTAAEPRRTKPLRRLGALALSCALVAAVTPAGPSLLLAPLSVSGYTRFVSEWDPPRLASPPVAVTLLLLAVVAAIWVRSGRRVSWASLLVWVVALGLAMAYTRTVAVAAAMAAPLVVAVVSSVLPRSRPRAATTRDGAGSSGSPWSPPWSSAECCRRRPACHHRDP